jgi:hypothetical protein
VKRPSRIELPSAGSRSIGSTAWQIWLLRRVRTATKDGHCLRRWSQSWRGWRCGSRRCKRSKAARNRRRPEVRALLKDRAKTVDALPELERSSAAPKPELPPVEKSPVPALKRYLNE